jgi:predicted enzyme related to lactoylglutathione lyase
MGSCLRRNHRKFFTTRNAPRSSADGFRRTTLTLIRPTGLLCKTFIAQRQHHFRKVPVPDIELDALFGYIYLPHHDEGESVTHRGLIGAVLYAKDLDCLVEFYSSVAGIEPRSVEKRFAVLGAGPSQFVIVRIPEHIADTIEIATPPEPREDTPLKLVFGVEDIAHARNRAAELGGAINAAEREWEFEGAKVCDGYDPEGNVFRLRQTD